MPKRRKTIADRLDEIDERYDGIARSAAKAARKLDKTLSYLKRVRDDVIDGADAQAVESLKRLSKEIRRLEATKELLLAYLDDPDESLIIEALRSLRTRSLAAIAAASVLVASGFLGAVGTAAFEALDGGDGSDELSGLENSALVGLDVETLARHLLEALPADTDVVVFERANHSLVVSQIVGARAAVPRDHVYQLGQDASMTERFFVANEAGYVRVGEQSLVADLMIQPTFPEVDAVIFLPIRNWQGDPIGQLQLRFYEDGEPAENAQSDEELERFVAMGQPYAHAIGVAMQAD